MKSIRNGYRKILPPTTGIGDFRNNVALRSEASATYYSEKNTGTSTEPEGNLTRAGACPKTPTCVNRIGMVYIRAIGKSHHMHETDFEMAYKHNFLNKKTVAILDTIPFGVYFCDASAIVRYINKPYADYIGVDPKKIIGKEITDFIPSSRARLIIESGKEEMYDSVSVFQKKKRTILVNRIPVTNEKGETEGFISQLFSVGKGEWQNIWGKIEQAEKTVKYLQQERGKAFFSRSETIIGNSQALLCCMEKIESYARSELPVLITGDTGVGKELFANAIHRNSPYANGPIVSINCGALPAELIESELFGYVPGAFTNAVRMGKKGRIELADKGTLFLDELGDLPLRAQASLLRVLETREVQRIGSNQLHPINFRLVAATNQDLEAKIRLGQFREDFYYRVNILRLVAPSLMSEWKISPTLLNTF